MAQLVDLFAYLSVLLRGAVLVLQALAVGGVGFERLVLRPLGDDAGPVAESQRRVIAGASLALGSAWLLWLALDSAVLAGTSDLGLADIAGASFFVAGSLASVCAFTLAALSLR